MKDYSALAKSMLGFELNSDQLTAVTTIVEWANSGFNNEPYHILGGYAGTGKSTIVKLITHLIEGRPVLCAPTNKAVKVLRALDTDCDCCTIYSLLGLKMEQHEDKLKLSKALKDKVGKYSIIVLDESGMVGSKLLEYIENAAKMYGIKVLFVGDPKQLNPVGEPLSPIWGRYPTSVLKTVERHDNQILEFVTKVRSTKLDDLVIKDNNDGNEGVWYLTDRDFTTRICEYAKAGKFEGNTRAIAWRNKTVDHLNRIIRQSIYGDRSKTERFIVGDRIVFTSPFALSDDESVITDDEGKITDIDICPHYIYQDFKVYVLTMMLNDEYPITVRVIHEDSEDDLIEEMSLMAIQARKCVDYKKQKSMWAEYWKMKESFAEMKHGHALTAHRAQGSTYDTVFVDTNDILSNSNRGEAKRAFYVAASRPTTQLFLN